MRVFRPTHLRFEFRDSPDARLQQLLAADATAVAGRWYASAAHLDAPVELETADLALFQAIPEEGLDAVSAAAGPGGPGLSRLLTCGVLLSDSPQHGEHRRRDQELRRVGWWGPAAIAQREGRWDSVDIADIEASEGKRGVDRMIAEGGLPPTENWHARPGVEGLPLPVPRKSALDALLAARSTCRNFDPARDVPLSDLAAVLHRVFGAQASRELAPGAVMLKKNSPSGGGLHPIEAFLLVQRVEGLAPGLYHYRCQDHALETMQPMARETVANTARELVAGQSWFANAPVLVLMAARFERTFWKYRNHVKAWKVIQLDAGHLSQNLYLSATELGYGAFITGAINDVCAERLFGLDGISTGAIAVCGFGKRAAEAINVEFDPLGKAVR